MRWLVAAPGPAYSVADVYVGWVEALRGLGQQVATNNLDERLCFYDNVLLPAGDGVFRKALTSTQATELAVNGLYSALFRLRPDVLLAVSGLFLPANLYDYARRAGIAVVIVHTESPYEDDRQVAVAPHADLNLVNDPTNLDKFRSVAKAVYVPHAYRPSVHYPGPPVPDLVCDLGFVGTGYESRIRFFEAMDLDGLDVLLAGNWQQLAEDSPLLRYVEGVPGECMDNERAAELYRSMDVGINLYRREAQRPELSAGWACGPREIEMAATGCFFLRDPRGEGDGLFPGLPTFSSPAEASELLHWWLTHPALRQDAAEAARLAVADRTFAAHAKHLLRLLDA